MTTRRSHQNCYLCSEVPGSAVHTGASSSSSSSHTASIRERSESAALRDITRHAQGTCADVIRLPNVSVGLVQLQTAHFLFMFIYLNTSLERLEARAQWSGRRHVSMGDTAPNTSSVPQPRARPACRATSRTAMASCCVGGPPCVGRGPVDLVVRHPSTDQNRRGGRRQSGKAAIGVSCACGRLLERAMV
jgi:hypothetical protein